jgi:predicted permease
MKISGQPFTVIGVAPAGFDGTTLGARPELFVPLSMRGVVEPGWVGFENRKTYWEYVFGRLAPGATTDQAATALNSVFGHIISDVEAPLQEGMSDATMARFRAKKVIVEQGSHGQSSAPKEARMPLLLMFATTAVVLLIACANIANLLLARGANRGIEMAVRLSIGASRWQVVRQLLVEAVVLAMIGGLASLLVAEMTLKGIAAILPPEASSSLALHVNGSVALFACLLACATGLLFGLFPALHSTRSDLISTIRSNAGNLTVTKGAARFRAILVTTQIALSMALLIVAGLFLRSLVNVSHVKLGVNIENVVTFGVSPGMSGYDPAHSRQLLARIESDLAALPGVTAVTSSVVPMIANNNWGTSVHVEGFANGPDVDDNSRLNYIGANYFGSFNVPLLSGREFTRSDTETGLKVAVVNQAFVDKFKLGRNAVGKRMSANGDDALDVTIVGVVPNFAYSTVKDEVPPVFFTPWHQNKDVGELSYYVRSPLPAAQVVAAVRAAVRRVDSSLPLQQLKTMPQQVRENIFLDRMISTMSGVFATLATVLAAVGLYGVLAYTVAMRTREIGVRMALGATTTRVRGMVINQTARMFVIGGIIGIVAAVFIGRAASSILYKMKGTDPVVFTLAVLVLGLFALGAGFLPALRASRVQPSQALRYE